MNNSSGGDGIPAELFKILKDDAVKNCTIKLLEENIGKTLSDINHSRILYDSHPRILETKTKRNK